MLQLLKNKTLLLSCFILTCLSGHINKSPVSVVLEQEVGSVLIVTEHIRPALAEDRSNNHATAACTTTKLLMQQSI